MLERIHNRLMTIRRQTMVADVMKAGNVTQDVAEKAVAALETTHPVVDWIATFRWDLLLQLALALLPLILRDGKPEPRNESNDEPPQD